MKHLGVTKSGKVVHAQTHDHLPTETAYQRFNKACAIWITKNVGSMTAFWIFTAFCMLVLPSVLYAMGVITTKNFLTTFGFELLMTWFLSTYLELVLMPAIMVGQNLQSAASDTRAEKQFEDTEKIVDALNVHTQGGLKDVLDAINSLKSK